MTMRWEDRVQNPDTRRRLHEHSRRVVGHGVEAAPRWDMFVLGIAVGLILSWIQYAVWALR